MPPSTLRTSQTGEGEKFLYLTPFFTAEDERAVASALALFDGVYAEGSWGVKFAEQYHKKLFAGTGFNLTNRFAVQGAKGAGAEYFAPLQGALRR